MMQNKEDSNMLLNTLTRKTLRSGCLSTKLQHRQVIQTRLQRSMHIVHRILLLLCHPFCGLLSSIVPNIHAAVEVAALQVGGTSARTVLVAPAEAVTVGWLLWLKLDLGLSVGGEQVIDAKTTCEQLGPDLAWHLIPMVLVTSGAPLGKTVTVPSHFSWCVDMPVGLL